MFCRPDPHDYGIEQVLLDSIYDQLPSGVNHPMRDLLDPAKQDGVANMIASLTGYLQNSTSQAVHNNVSPLLDAFAAAIQTATLTTHARDRETFTRDLICSLEDLSASADFPAQYAGDITSIITELRHSRLTNDPVARINAIRAAYFLVYDSWDKTKNNRLVYTILSDISILCDKTDDTPEMRRHVFFAAFDHFSRAILDKQQLGERWW